MATVEVVPEEICGCVWSPFVPTLTPTTNLFCFKGLEDNWAETSDYSDCQLSLPDRDSTPKSQSSRGGEGCVAGRNKTTSTLMDDEWIYDDQPWMVQGWIQCNSMDFKFYSMRFNGFSFGTSSRKLDSMELSVFKCGEVLFVFI